MENLARAPKGKKMSSGKVKAERKKRGLQLFKPKKKK
jgi:hypothetical protein